MRLAKPHSLSNQSKTFTIPWRTRDGMRVELDLSNGVWCLVDEVLVDPGEELLVEVDPNDAQALNGFLDIVPHRAIVRNCASGRAPAAAAS